MQYADTIKEIRKKLSLSQEDLARELGVSFATINRWERGKTNPSRMAIKVIEDFCSKHAMGDGGTKVEDSLS